MLAKVGLVEQRAAEEAALVETTPAAKPLLDSLTKVYRSRAELGETKPVWAGSCSIGLRASPSFQRLRREGERT